MALRVAGGRFRGRRLVSPRGTATRPSSGRMRIAVMNILGAAAVEGASVLDLYAGTGASGIEALSRGARRALFVERAAPALKALERNLRELGLGGEEAQILRADAVHALRGGFPLEGAPFRLVFCDPPYGVFEDPVRTRALREALGALAASGGLSSDATVILEHPAARGFGADPPRLRTADQRAYSSAGVSFLRPLESTR